MANPDKFPQTQRRSGSNGTSGRTTSNNDASTAIVNDKKVIMIPLGDSGLNGLAVKAANAFFDALGLPRPDPAVINRSGAQAASRLDLLAESLLELNGDESKLKLEFKGKTLGIFGIDTSNGVVKITLFEVGSRT